MRPLSDDQLDKIEKIIQEHIGVLMGVFGGDKRKQPKKLAEKLGFDPNSPSFVEQAYILGKLRETISDEVIDSLTYDQLIARIKGTQLTSMEKEALSYAQRQAGKNVTNAERKISVFVSGTNNRLGYQSMMEKTVVGNTVSHAIQNRQTRGKLVSELGHATGDWTRDWERVANTELWNARLNANAQQILNGDSIYSSLKGKAARVFKRPAPDACKHCKRLHLEDDGITPKIFYLHELIANGDNVGRKTAEWKAVVGVVHPNCNCPLEAMPEGFTFDENGDLVPV